MHIPDHLTDRDGAVLEVLRAWPRGGGRLIFEAVEPANARRRAGSIDAAGVARITPFGEDPGLTGLSQAVANGDLLVHRYKRRAVVRSGGQYRKLLPPGKSAGVRASHQFAARTLLQAGFIAPDLVSTDAASVSFSAVPGLSLHELGQAHDAGSSGEWDRAWQLWSLHWPLFARNPASAQAGADSGGLMCQGAAEYSAADEGRTVRQWVERTAEADALGVSPERLNRALDRVLEKLDEETGHLVLAHRDLHDKQMLFDPSAGSVGVIDCDTLALAEPALDLANVLVHLDFRVAQGVLSAELASSAKRYILEAAAAMNVEARRLQAYTAATALRLACIYAFRPPYRTMAAQWFEGFEEILHSNSAAALTSP